MKDPRRFIDGDAQAGLTPEGRLLRSALVDAAPARVRHATFVALGVTAASAGMSASVGAATVGGAKSVAGAGAGVGAVGTKVLGVAALAKWTAMGVLSGVLTLGSIQAVKHARQPSSPSTSLSSPTASGSPLDKSVHAEAGVTDRPHAVQALAEGGDNPVPTTHLGPLARPGIQPEQKVVSLESVPVDSFASPPEPSPSATAGIMGQAGAAQPNTDEAPGAISSAAVPPLPPNLVSELRMLDRARSMVASGDGRGAMGVLDAYRRQHPHPALAPEEEVLRIESLACSGRQSEALQRARRFLELQPKSPQAPRIRALFERLSISQ